MAKTINRLAVQQSLVRNGLAEHEAAVNVANDLGDEIDEVTSDLATKRDLEDAVAQINKRMDDNVADLRLEIAAVRTDMEALRTDFATLRADFATLRTDMEARDRERAERESEWWRQQQERDDAWRKEMQKRDDARQARDDAWRKDQQARDDKWRKEQQERDDAWRKEMQKRDDRAHAREVAAAKASSRLLWAIFGSTAALGTVIGVVIAFAGG